MTPENAEITIQIKGKDDRNGLVAVDTYLWDAAARLGVSLAETAGFDEEADDAIVTVTSGTDNLSTPTSAEMQKLTDEQRAGGERLARHTRIQRTGEITIMVKEKVVEPKERSFKEDFEKLPFEQKFSTLVQLEAVALGESLNFIFNLPRNIIGKGVDVLASFGWKMDENSRGARRPEDHRAAAPEPETKSEPATAE